MDNALRMNDDLYAVHLDAKKPVRLDHFQTLVEQRRGIDCDLWPHIQGRMVELLFGGDRVEILSRRHEGRFCAPMKSRLVLNVASPDVDAVFPVQATRTGSLFIVTRPQLVSV